MAGPLDFSEFGIPDSADEVQAPAQTTTLDFSSQADTADAADAIPIPKPKAARPGKFETKLTSDEEDAFQQWKAVNAPKDSGEDYDLRGAYKAGLKPAANGHWPDTFKKPNHPTFSVESQYAKDAPDLAGSWDGDTYVPPKGKRPRPTLSRDMAKHAKDMQQLEDGDWYSRNDLGIVWHFDAEGFPDRVVDDPAVLKHFGQSGPTKPAQLAIKNQDAGLINQPKGPKEPSTVQKYTQEFSRAAGKGAVDTTAMMLKHFAAAGVVPERAKVKILADLEGAKDMDDAAYVKFSKETLTGKGYGSLAQAIAQQMRSGAIARPQDSPLYPRLLKGITTKPLKEQDLYKLAERIKTSVAGPEFQPQQGFDNESWTVMGGQGLGSTVPILGASLLGAGPVLGGELGVAMSGGSQIEDAEEAIKKATRDDRGEPHTMGGLPLDEMVLKAGEQGAPIGVTEQAPIEMLLQRTAAKIPGLGKLASTPVFGKFLKAAGKMLTQAAAEGGQEGVQQVYQNLVAQLSYDPGRKWDEQALQSVLVGAALGGAMEVGPTIYDAVKREKGQQPPGAPPPPGAAPGAPPPPPPGGPAGPGPAGPAPTVNTAAKGNKAKGPLSGPEQAELLASAGYTLEDVRGMTPAQYRQTIEDLQAQGATVQPGATLKSEKPIPGGAPMAPKPQPKPNLQNGASSQPAEPMPIAEEMPAEGPTDWSRDIDIERYIRDAVKKGTSPEAIAENFRKEGAPEGAIAYTRRRAAALSKLGAEPIEGQIAVAGALDFRPQAEDAGDGTRTKPVKVVDDSDVQAAREQVAPEPTEAQAAAGNYKKGHVKLHGLDITIETPKGGKRTGKNPDGTDWSVDMQDDYGYVKRSTGADGEQVDVFLGPNHGSQRVFIINQVDPDTKAFDEHKVIMGADHARQAENIYDRAFSDGSGERRMGSIEEMDVSQFKDWLDAPQKAPASGKAPEAAPETAAEPRIGYTAAPDEDFDAIFDQAVDEQFAKTAEGKPASVSPPVNRSKKGSGEQTTPGSAIKWRDLDSWLAGVDALARRRSSDKSYKQADAHWAAADNFLPAWLDTATEPQLEHVRQLLRKPKNSGNPWGAPHRGQRKGTLWETANQIVTDRLAQMKRGREDVIPEGPNAKAAREDAEREKKPAKPLTLLQFIAWNGGIREDKGEMAARDLTKKFIPGYGPLVRKTGKSPSAVLESAIQEGYIIDPSRNEGGESNITIEDLYAAIDAEHAGKPIYANDKDAHTAQERAEAKKVKASEQELDRYSPAERAFIDKHGFDTFESLHLAIVQVSMEWGDVTPEALDAAAVAINDGMDAHDALEQGVVSTEPDEDVDLANQHEGDIPTDDEVHAGTTLEGGEGIRAGGRDDQGSRAQEAPRGPGEEPEDAGEAGEHPEATKSAVIQAEDSDETVTVSLTPKGPWDFNDTFPAPLAIQPRNGFHFDDDVTVEEIVHHIQQSINSIIGSLYHAQESMQTKRDILSGKLKPPPALTVDQRVKQLDTHIKEAKDNIDGEVGTNGDMFGRDAAAAMLREARRTVASEKPTASSPKPQKPKAAAPTDYEAAISAHNDALKSYNKAVKAYRAKEIGDQEFLAARAKKEEADKAFDAAFTAEQKREPAAEAGADEMPQLVLPGAEQIGQGEQAQRKSDEKLKPKVAQKPIEHGLFGDEKDQTDIFDTPKRSAGEAAVSAVKQAAMGLDDVASGLTRLFGADPNRLGSSPGFDEETYKKALPFFRAGAAHFAAAGKDSSEVIRLLVKYLAEKAQMTRAAIENMRPYIRRFMEDIKAGKETIDALPSSDDLESDRGATAAQDRLGETDVPASGASARPGTRARGEPDLPGGERSGSGGGVSESDAAPVGERGHLEIPRDEPEPTPRAGEPDGRERGGEDGREGLPPDREPNDKAISAATKEARIAERRRAQAAAENTTVKLADKASVAETLPMLFPEQQDDVYRTELRFQKPNGFGMLLTNGTGTGKTYSGLGVAKRFDKRGKKNILVVAPSQGILMDWQRSAGDMQMQGNILQSLEDKGQGFTLTTYANLGANQTLADRDWDLIITDEAHKLSSDKDGTISEAARALRALTGHPDGFTKKAEMVFRKEWAEVQRLLDRAKSKTALISERHAATEAYAAWTKKIAPHIEKWKQQPRNRVLMMSATPFAYHFSLDYADGYLFEFDPNIDGSGYNSGDGRQRFYIENFGYRMKTNRLTKPEADVNSEIMERQFHEKLKKEGSLWGRALEVDKDYDRRFVLVEDVIGGEIDRALDFLNEAEDGRFRELGDVVRKKFDYLARMRLLEAIKAKNATAYIKASHAIGRKVVVFHDYNEGGGFNPFDLSFGPDEKFSAYVNGKRTEVKALDLYNAFLAANPYVKELKFADYLPPIQELKKQFPDALVYNGTIPVMVRDQAKKRFNDETDQGANLIIVQSAAGEAGISLHDIVGKHQRTLLNLGMPIRPTASLQQEGRIYRVGQETDALFRYMSTGTNWERWTFAGKIAERAGTAENLALGNQARTIRQSFIDAYTEADFYPPEEGEGKGGKERDRALTQNISEYEKAKTHYFAQQKNKKRRDQREGIDYFATPEPLGLKMVEWADVKPGEKMLEPSAGHGAIARYFPETTARTIVEPSSELASRAALNSPNARTIVDRFENLDIVNKYDAIVMNPPFGQGGSTAIKHLEKAASHLRNGGRIVALIPNGPAADKRFASWMEHEAEDIHIVDIILLPSVTFERAGTSASARVIILEKQKNKDDAAKVDGFSGTTLANAETVKDFFDRLEHVEVAKRIEPAVKEVDQLTTGVHRITVGAIEFEVNRTSHDPKDQGVIAYPKNKIGGRFAEVAKLAEVQGGRWSKAMSGFPFPSIDAANRFFQSIANPPPAPEIARPDGKHTFTTGDTINVKKGAKTYVATINERVERDVYDQILAIAKKHGGYYSSYAKQGAIPGFQFETPAARAAFIAEVTGESPQPTPPAPKQGTFESLEKRSSDELRPTIPAEKRADIIGKVQFLANQILGRSIRLGVVDELESGSQGRYDPHLRAAIVAIRTSLDSVETFGHEAIHALRDIGAITKPEWAAISRWAREAVLPTFKGAQLYREHYGSRYNLTPEQLDDVVLEEAIAEYFGRFLTGKTGDELPNTIRQIFARVREFLERIRNYLNGAGYRTAGDIFAGIARGEKRDAPVKESSRNYELEQVGADIHDLIDFAKSGPGNETKTVEIGPVSPVVADILKQDLGVDVSAFVHTIDAFAIRHMLKEHGEPESEISRGQLPVTDADIEAIPTMLSQATAVVTGLKGRRDQDIVGYLTRSDDGAVIYLEEVRTGRERLAALSMRKYPPATKSENIVSGLSPNVRDVPGSTLNIRPIPGSGKKGTFESLRSGGRMPKAGPNAAPAVFTEPEDDPMAHLTNQNIGMLARVRGASAAALLPTRRAMQDDMADQLRVEQALADQTGPLNPAVMAYRAHTLYSGRAGERLENLRYEDLEPMLDEMVREGITHEMLDDYLYARHAPERNAHVAGINPQFPDGGSGMTNAEAAQIMANLHNVLPALQSIAAHIDRIQREARDRLLAAGLIDQATYDNWTNYYQHYVPLQGFEQEPDEDARPAVGQRYDTRVKLTHAALGRSTRADSPLAYVIAKAQQSIILSEKARANRTLFRLVRQFPNPRLWTVNQILMKRFIDKTTGLVAMRPDSDTRMRATNVVVVKIGGKTFTITLHHDGLARGWKGMEAAAMPSFVRVLAGLGRYFALTRTGLNPEFFLPNFLRDLGTAGVHITADQGGAMLRTTVKNLPKAMRGIWQHSRGNNASQWAQYAEEFSLAGGKVGVFGLQNVENIKDRISWDLWKAAPGKLPAIARGGTALYDFMMDVNGAIENAVRLSLYVAMRRAGHSQDAAAFAAKEVTVNFNRKGNWGAWINAGYLFFNAGVQGTARVAKALTNKGKAGKIARRFAYGLIIAGFLSDIINSMMSGDDDDDGEKDYDQLPEYLRERNFILLLPGSTKGISPSLPWVYNVFNYAGVNMGRLLRGKIGPGEAMANIGGALLQAANPVQSATLRQILSPTLLDPVGDIEANTDWKGEPIYPDRGDLDKRPDSQKYFKSVDPIWEGITDFLNSATGGDEVRPGAIDVSPESVEYIADFLGGGVASFYNNLLGTTGSMVRGEKIDYDKVPILRRFLFDVANPRTGRDEYYRILDAVEITKRQIKFYRDKREPEKAVEIAKAYPADVQIQPVLKAWKKPLEDLKAKRDGMKTAAEKEAVSEEMDVIMSKVRKRYRELLKSTGQKG